MIGLLSMTGMPETLEAAQKTSDTKSKSNYPIYSLAVEGTYNIPPELRNFKKTTSRFNVVNAKKFGLNPAAWQSDPSRIIYHEGMYHVWLIDSSRRACGRGKPDGNDQSSALYLISKDTKHWMAVDYLPLGPKGSCDDIDRLQVNVVHHEGKFYMFYEAFTTNIAKYGRMRCGIAGLVADSPAGRWKRFSDDLLLRRGKDKKSWDFRFVTNPRHIYLNGKWFMYYKAAGNYAWKNTASGERWTKNGVAIADSITGPYIKYEGNPLMVGHGHFCWRYKHGMLYMPFASGTILWSEDGTHFSPPLNKQVPKTEFAVYGNHYLPKELFVFGSLYVPYDPLFGKPVTDKPGMKFWGLDNRHPGKGGPNSSKGGPGSWTVERMEWSFGGE